MSEQHVGDALQKEGGGRGKGYQPKPIGPIDELDISPSFVDDDLRALNPTRTEYVKTVERKTEYPEAVLVCAACEEYHDHDEDWEVCPQCAEDLIEVDRA